VRTTYASCACAFTRSQILELFHDVTYQTSCGQLIDLITAPIGQARGFAIACMRPAYSDCVGLQVDLSKYTIETYMRIVTYKTAFYTFYLPAASAMHLCGIEDERAFDLARDICVRLGQFFQIQDDYLDCYGDPAVIGKVGTDIEDNKCSWLVVQALARCSDAQRKVFEVRCCPGPVFRVADACAAAELWPERPGEGGSYQGGVRGAEARGGVPRVREQEL
jgi:farnesyl diphosphate synthase